MTIRSHSPLFPSLVALAAACCLLANARAAFLLVSLPGESSQSLWTGLTAANYPGYPTYTTSTSPWPSAITPTGGAVGPAFNKVSGLGFPSNGGGIYVGGLTSGTGTFAVSTTSPLADLETIVFQLEIEGVGASWGSVFSALSLNYNGGSQALAANWTQEVSAINTGTMFGQPSTRFTLAFQWDLSAVVDPITSLNLVWTGAEHSITSNLQLNQGDTMAQVVPEPSTWFLLLLGAGAAGIWKMRASRQQA